MNVLSQCIEDSEDPSSVSLLEEHAMFKGNVIALINSRIHDPKFGINYVTNEIVGYEYKVMNAATDFINDNIMKLERMKPDIDTKFL